MSTELDHARQIAERIARRMSADSGAKPNPAQPKPAVSSELAAVRAGISELQKQLAQLEAKVGFDPMPHPPAPGTAPIRSPVPITHSPWLAGINSSYSHPSQEKFGVEEAVVSELVDYFEKEKICSVEPGAKPCDHCAMCSSRGF
jgi:hypothetical protein